MIGMSQYKLGCTSMYWYILAYFVNSGFLSYSLVLFWIQGGTRRYKAVPKSPVPLDNEVQGSTRPLYHHVLPCTSLFRGTGLLGTALYRLVPISLPCTALYRLVSRRGQGGMTVYQNGHPGMFQFVSKYSSRRKYV